MVCSHVFVDPGMTNPNSNVIAAGQNAGRPGQRVTICVGGNAGPDLPSARHGEKSGAPRRPHSLPPRQASPSAAPAASRQWRVQRKTPERGRRGRSQGFPWAEPRPSPAPTWWQRPCEHGNTRCNAGRGLCAASARATRAGRCPGALTSPSLATASLASLRHASTLSGCDVRGGTGSDWGRRVGGSAQPPKHTLVRKPAGLTFASHAPRRRGPRRPQRARQTSFWTGLLRFPLRSALPPWQALASARARPAEQSQPAAADSGVSASRGGTRTPDCREHAPRRLQPTPAAHVCRGRAVRVPQSASRMP